MRSIKKSVEADCRNLRLLRVVFWIVRLLCVLVVRLSFSTKTTGKHGFGQLEYKIEYIIKRLEIGSTCL